MELPQRIKDDRFLPTGYYRSLEQELRTKKQLEEVRTLVVSSFDRTTRILPFVYFDRYMVPCGPRSVAGALANVGMQKTRLLFQLWNPNLQPCKAEIDGKPIDMLLISSMQIHSAPSYKLIEDAYTLGEDRPLIIAGGPKACYEPFDYFGLGVHKTISADVVVTGEEPVLLQMLLVLSEFGAGSGSMRQAFNRARKAGALEEIPGLVYPKDEHYDGQNLVNTGIQKLLCDLDELPMPDMGFSTLEPPHRRKTLSARPIPIDKVARNSKVVPLLISRGCKFRCHYCPIPAYNQGTIRYKSPQRIIEEFVQCAKEMDMHTFFGTDDNFFNNIKYVREIFETMAATSIDGEPLRRYIKFSTEATVIDLYKNRDMLPLARSAGLRAVWMGVEDLSAKLINKGQTPEVTEQLFSEMLKHRILPMVMLMHYDDQPLRSPGELTGLIDQIRFLQNAGALSLQCTVASPAFGTKWVNEMFEKNLIYARVGHKELLDAQFDGNHVIAGTCRDPWRVQLNLLRGYAAFYNPRNFLRALLKKGESKSISGKRLFFQAWGIAALIRTAWNIKGYLWRLWKGPIERKTDWPKKFRQPGSPYPELIKSEKSSDNLRNTPQEGQTSVGSETQ